jgi:hypothetical protein
MFIGLTVSSVQHGITACLLGEPDTPEETENYTPQIDPMDAVCEVFQSLDNIILQVFVEPTKSRKQHVRALERAYENAMERSQKVVSAPRFFSADSQQSTTRVNASASREAERLSRQVKRMSSRYLGKVSVVVTHWHKDKKLAETQTKRVMSVLVSGITPADKEEDLRVVIKKRRKDLEKALAGRPVGKHTILTPDETATYFALPKVDLGIKVSRREDFSVASVNLPEIEKTEEVNLKREVKQLPSAHRRVLALKNRSASQSSGSWLCYTEWETTDYSILWHYTEDVWIAHRGLW